MRGNFLLFEKVKSVLVDALDIVGREDDIKPETGLLGNLPELDSMTVVHVIIALEEEFGFTVDDDEISAEVFENVASLVEFVDRKLNG